jgi:hypothetical protein
MAIPSFFKQNKPRGFNYIPRYYDPAKEEMEQRRRALGLDSDATGDNRKDHENHNAGENTSGNETARPYRSKIMRGDMKHYFPRRHDRVRKQNTIRLFVILIIIVLIVYIYLRF